MRRGFNGRALVSLRGRGSGALGTRSVMESLAAPSAEAMTPRGGRAPPLRQPGRRGGGGSAGERRAREMRERDAAVAADYFSHGIDAATNASCARPSYSRVGRPEGWPRATVFGCGADCLQAEFSWVFWVFSDVSSTVSFNF